MLLEIATTIVAPAVVAAFVWWFGTGVILYVDGLPRRTHFQSLVLATIVAAGAIGALVGGLDDATTRGAYVGFFVGIALWSWHELAFLVGAVTGPRRVPCPPEARGWRRAWLAFETILHHELALAATLAVLAWVSWDAANPMAFWTFGVLWLMRVSAKLNVFFGVPNLAEEFLPDHLSYLPSYFRKGPMSAFFPISVTAATAFTVVLTLAAAGAADGFALTAFVLLASLSALAVFEHWLMVLPVEEAALWRWALEARRAARRDPSAETPSALARTGPRTKVVRSRSEDRRRALNLFGDPRAAERSQSSDGTSLTAEPWTAPAAAE